MKIYVVLYQDLWLETCKVSQEAYKTLQEARMFCEMRLGIYLQPSNPAIYIKNEDNRFVYGNSVTKQQFTIVEVTV